MAPRDPNTIACFAPGSREVLGSIRVDRSEDVRAAIERARVAQRQWTGTSFAERSELLHKIADLLIEKTDEYVNLIVRDSGKTRENALMGEIMPVCEKIRWTAKHGPRHLKPERVSSGALLHKRARIEFAPLGVVGAILPWNYPLQNILNPVIPALMAGNSIVLKPSEWVAWSSQQFVEELRELIAGAGYPADIVQVVQGYGETGEALVTGGVDVVLFIGSGTNGRRVLKSAAENFVPVVLELGGKDPFIVCDDANLDAAVHAALGGCFINAGQNCVASERIILHRSIADEFERRVAAFVEDFAQGESSAETPVDIGAMITPLQLERVEELVRQAIDEGARLVTGGQRTLTDQGDFFEPTVLADLTPEMTIMHEEVFGPVMLLCSVESDDEAIRVANGTPFGLGATVFSRSRERGRNLAARIESGMVAINDFGGLTYMAQDLPFGGIKDSGFGRMNGRAGLRSFTNERAVLEDRFPFSVPSRIFPVRSDSYAQQRAAIRAMYGRGVRARLRAVTELLTRKGEV